MYYRKYQATVYLAGLLCHFLPEKSRSEFRVDIVSDNGSAWGGFIKPQGPTLIKTKDHVGIPLEKSKDSEGIPKIVDLKQTQQIIFYETKPPESTFPYEDGPLPPPWQSKAVGVLPRGGSSEAKNGSIVIETSSPPKGTTSNSFYTAYLPLPEGNSYITARVSRIDTYEETTQSGITIRSADPSGYPGVFLALSHRQPATLVQWPKSYSGIVPRFTSQTITRKNTPQWVNIDIDVSKAKKLLLVTHGEGSMPEFNWANWINPRLTIQGTEQKLTELTWKSADTGWGKVNKNKNAAGKAIQLGGIPQANGIGTTTDSLIQFDLPPGTSRFMATAGLDDAAPQHPRVKFMVFTTDRDTTLGDIPKIYRDPRNDSKVGQWIRLTRNNGLISAYISKDGKLWREFSTIADEISGSAFAGIMARGTKPRRRWATFFDHVETGSMQDLGQMHQIEPRIALVNGTIIHEKIEKASPSLFYLGGSNNNRVIPALSIARIEYHYPLDPQFDETLAGKKEGLILSSGDFFESQFSGINNNRLTARSVLFGKRTFELDRSINAIVLRPALKTTPKGSTYMIETWRGGRIYARNFRISDNHMILETIRLGTQRLSFEEIRRVSRI